MSPDTPKAPGYVTASRAAVLLDVNEKTVRLWIKSGKLSAENHGSEKRPIHGIPMSEVERILRERQDAEAASALPGPRELAEQLAQLKEQVGRMNTGDQIGQNDQLSNIEERLRNLEHYIYQQQPNSDPAPAPATPRPRRSPSEPSSISILPDGAVLLTDFAATFNINRRTAADHVEKGIDGDYLDASVRPKPGRPKEKERTLTVAQQQAALAFWRRHGWLPPEDEHAANTD